MLVGLPCQSQAPERREFEVASIRPDKSGPSKVWVNPFIFSPGGRFTATNVTLVDMVVMAYKTRRIQLEGGPSWIDVDRFDIVAKADADDGEVSQEQRYSMVQAFLEDRFKLTLHRTTKERDVYALMVGKEPPKIQESKEVDQPYVVSRGDKGESNFHRTPIVALVNTMSNILGAPVVDRTGITGFFDFTINPDQYHTPGVRDNYADLFLTAVKEQLGFKLEKQKAPLEITVIDRAERPSDN